MRVTNETGISFDGTPRDLAFQVENAGVPDDAIVVRVEENFTLANMLGEDLVVKHLATMRWHREVEK